MIDPAQKDILAEIYRRNILVPAVGREGQEKIFNSRALIVGAGGLGSPAAFYLAAAGIGKLGLADGDVVELSNLQRQILYGLADLGQRKVAAAGAKLESLNGHTRVETYPVHLDENNASGIIRQYDLVVDCTDTITMRYLLNRVCLGLNKPLVHGGVLGMAGQLMTVIPRESACFRCAFPAPALAASAPTTGNFGVLGAVAGVIGSLQAAEAVKIVLGKGGLLTNRLVFIDCLKMRFCEESVPKIHDCPDCGALDLTPSKSPLF